ncbi:type II secretion system F family protein [Paraburkholderia humisilvae]|uniref:Toxin coregulated pilus biosynthesis protein E n=1 Tax=Paraburkholderia humisilvae TaxID=627669 RepID=A0A6J5F1E3_9BURK|nr:type II secretion system F family protein [Paraburkholderia humisilvae]CAB3772174.1 Toxin coregulated pilus biosynthesis protein E [Paraburkholderia humisilvae]
MAFDVNRHWARLQLTAQARLRIYRKIAKMLANGLPLLRVLEELELRASSEGRKPNEPQAIVLSDWRRVVQNGGMLSEAMQGWVPQTEQMIIMAGEQSGRLETSLTSVSAVVTSGRRIRMAIVGGLAYPAAILAMTIGYVFLFGKLVIPRFAMIVSPDRWHGVAHSLYTLSRFVQSGMIYCVLLLAALVTLMFYSMPRWSGRTRVLLDRYPPYSIYRLIVGSGFLVAFSSLQTAGFTVEKSLNRLADTARPWLRERIDDMLFGVKSGLNVGEAMKNTGYRFPSAEIVDDLCVYAEYKGFADALRTLAEEWMQEGVETVESQMRVVNGVAIIVLTLVLSWLISGFFGIQQEIAAMSHAVH